MADNYSIPLEEFSLDEYEKFLESARVLPGRTILKEDIPQKFEIFRSKNINNLKELLERIKTKNRLQQFSQETTLSEEYLNMLRRQIQSLLSKPVYLKDFPEVDLGNVEKLADIGIKNSKKLFQSARTPEEREKLSKQVDVPLNYLLELVKLSDLARSGGVGPLFARMIYETGVDTTEKMAQISPKSLFSDLETLNKEKGYTKAKFVVEDVRYCVEFAKRLPKAIEY